MLAKRGAKLHVFVREFMSYTETLYECGEIKRGGMEDVRLPAVGHTQYVLHRWMSKCT